MINRFRLRLFRGRTADGEPELDVAGGGHQWSDYVRVGVPGFDGRVSIDLSSCWQQVLDSGLTELESVVTGYETIIKWGDTRQLTETFCVLIEATHS